MTKRLRIFAGPNGSGKSSIIQKILDTKVGEGKTLDFGIYVNADDIVVKLKNDLFCFSDYKIIVDETEFFDTIISSGLINDDFSLDNFKAYITIFENPKISHDAITEEGYERIAQILADFLRKKLLNTGLKFSFETVFSHEGKLDFIREAVEKGYKVYLYFVSTEDPDINVYRVKEVRVRYLGHDVEEEKIRSRYYRSMNLLYNAAQLCYQAYFFDNSRDGSLHTLFAHFKVNGMGEKEWESFDDNWYPNWFFKYYSDKINK